MPLPALTINNSQLGIPLKEDFHKKLKSNTIGSFRSNGDLKTLLPEDIFDSLFDPIPDNLDVRKLITIPNRNEKHYLNNAAFGRAYDDVLNLSSKLRLFAETNPDTFYDQACLHLIDNTYDVLEDFFDTDKIVLVPNCSFGLRSIMERLVREKHHPRDILLSFLVLHSHGKPLPPPWPIQIPGNSLPRSVFLKVREGKVK